MAVNTGGDVVLAYRSPGGDMRCWSGQATAGSDRVVWYRKGTYAVNPYTVSEPTLAINDDRWVASVYRVGPQPGQPGPAMLESRLGRMQDDGAGAVNRRQKQTIAWRKGREAVAPLPQGQSRMAGPADAGARQSRR